MEAIGVEAVERKRTSVADKAMAEEAVTAETVVMDAAAVEAGALEAVAVEMRWKLELRFGGGDYGGVGVGRGGGGRSAATAGEEIVAEEVRWWKWEQRLLQ